MAKETSLTISNIGILNNITKGKKRKTMKKYIFGIVNYAKRNQLKQTKANPTQSKWIIVYNTHSMDLFAKNTHKWTFMNKFN